MVKNSYAEKIVVVPVSLKLPELVRHKLCDVAGDLIFSLIFEAGMQVERS
jgi:UDP-3-O-acyl-N-acetylglucosamine deacetylase